MRVRVNTIAEINVPDADTRAMPLPTHAHTMANCAVLPR